MSEVQWNALMNAPNAGAAFTNAFQQGMQQRQQSAILQQQMQEHQEDRNRRHEQMQSEAAMRAVEQHREAVKTGAAIIRQVQPRDDASWQQALGMLQSYGINPQELGVPMQFDPSYIDGVTKLADALDPQKAERPQLVPFTQGGGVAAYDAQTGQIRTLVAPNDGGHQAGAPVGGGPAPGTIEDGYRFKGGNPADPNAWEPVNGGPTGNQSGGFL